MTDETFHFAYRYQVMDWARLGWMPRPHILDGTHHGGRAMMMEWLCDCPVVKPLVRMPGE